MEHPNLLLYDKTHESSCPLLLVFGREPNCDGQIINKMGKYDFDKPRRCCFWNRSYARIADAAGFTGWDLKRACRQEDSSPIAFADALPICIQYRIAPREKIQTRRDVPNESVQKHAREVFSHAEVINRVRAVILSGVRVPGTDRAERWIMSECRTLGIPVLHAPFFGNRSGNDHFDAALGEHHDVLREVLTPWLCRSDG